MKSKECLKYIAEKKGVDNITGVIQYNWKLYPDYFEKIERDLVRLEELEVKEIPMKVLVEEWELSSTDEKDIICPKCKALLGTTEEHYKSNYCFDCGQRLDWSLK